MVRFSILAPAFHLWDVGATLITMGMFTIDDVNQWIALVVSLVVAIVGLGQSILSALNTDRDEPTTEPRHGA